MPLPPVSPLSRLLHFWLLAWCMLMGMASSAWAQVCVNPGLQGDFTSTTAGPMNGYFTPGDNTYSAGTSPTIALSGGRGSTTWVAGDMAMLIQMQCVDLDRTDTDAYGDGVANRPATGYLETSAGTCKVGQYEYVLAAAGTSATQLVVGAPLQFTYVQSNPTASQPRRSFQVVRVPQFRNLTLGAQLDALAWDGSNGGVVALDISKSLNFGGQTISAVVAGFRGGGARISTANGNNPVRWREGDAVAHATKAEGIAGTPRYVWVDSSPFDQSSIVGTFSNLTALATTGYPGTGTTADYDFARGAPGNAGGGGQYLDGNYHNGGGGGGGNGGSGGRGAFGWRGSGWAGVLADYSNVEAITTQHLAAFGGSAFGGASLARVVMGGGGGAGDSNNNSGTLVETYGRLSGATGGGIVMLRANSMSGSGVVDLRGGWANHNPCNDAAGAGGAGGSLVAITPNWSANLTVNAQGGAGGDSWRFAAGCGTPGSAHSGGGGGAGGVIVRSDNITSGLTALLGGGINGKTNTADNPPGGEDHGAQPGGDGIDIPVPEATATPPNVGYKCLPQVDPSITKSATPTSLSIGQTVTFTLTIGNSGPAVARTVTVADTMPVGFGTVTFVSASGSNTTTTLTASAVAGTSTFRGTATVDVGQTLTVVLRAPVTANGSLLNTVTLVANDAQAETNVGNNTGSVTVVVGPAADLTALKRATPSIVSTGGTVTFTLVFTNLGPSAVTNARVTDTIPSNFGTVTFISATPSGGASWVSQTVAGLNFNGTTTLPANTSISVLLTAVAGTAGSALNTATIAPPAGVTDPTPANNLATAGVQIGTSVNIAVSKIASPTIAPYETNAFFTLTMVNVGAAAATPTLVDVLPAGLSGLTVTAVTTAGGSTVITQTSTSQRLTATVAMPAGSTVSFVLRVFTGAVGPQINQVTVTLPTGFVDTDPSNNTAQATVTIPVATGIGFTKTNVVTSLTAGQTTSYTITVANFGPNSANGMVVTDPVSAGLACTAVTCSSSGGAVCPAGPLNFATLSTGGYAINPFPASSQASFSVRCNVTATGQ